MVNRDQRKFEKDIKVSPYEECITRHKLLVSDYKIKKGEAKYSKKEFVPWAKIWNGNDMYLVPCKLSVSRLMESFNKSFARNQRQDLRMDKRRS